jgi:uncharacterized membrane protein
MKSGSGRQAYLDRVRGVAVLIMIEAHVLDSWTRVPDRTTHTFGWAMVLGGFGAPMFLFLAGIGLVLSAESKRRRGIDFDDAWHAAQKRGWQIFGLAFLFRLQAYILTAGYSAMSLLKVDILNVMGPAIALAAMAGRGLRSRTPRAILFAAIGLGIAMVTPIVRTTSALNWLPDPIEWYFRPTPGRTNFTLFPWSAFVFAGAAAGEIIDAIMASAVRPMKTQLALAAGAIVVALIGYRLSLLPSIYVPRSEFWTSSPTFFLLRVGLILLMLPLAFFWEVAPWRGVISRWSPIEELGKASLFVYWIHVEMVYGFISRPLRRALSFETAIGADIMFSIFLLALVLVKNRLVTARKAPPVRARGPSPAAI